MEELAAKHDVDLGFLRQFQENLDKANAEQSRWMTWCNPVLEQAQRIHWMLSKKPQQGVHPLDRPGITILQRKHLGEDLQVFIYVPDYPWLSLKFDLVEGISICSDVQHYDASSNTTRTVHAIARLERSWGSQTPIVKDSWPAPFETIEPVLSRVYEALLNNTPLGPTLDWPAALREQLAAPWKETETIERWEHWIQTWGTPEMMRSFRIVESLFDVEQHGQSWREQLLTVWSSNGEAIDLVETKYDENVVAFSRS